MASLWSVDLTCFAENLVATMGTLFASSTQQTDKDAAILANKYFSAVIFPVFPYSFVNFETASVVESASAIGTRDWVALSVLFCETVT